MPTMQMSRPESMAFSVAEFTALRDEIKCHIEHRHRFAEITLVATGVLLGVTLGAGKVAGILLFYPLFVLFLAWSWVHSGFVIVEIGKYIRQRYDQEDGGSWWESHLEKEVRPQRHILGFGPFENFAVIGIFLSVQVMSLLIGIHEEWGQFGAFDGVLLSVGVLALAATVRLVVYAVPRLRHGTNGDESTTLPFRETQATKPVLLNSRDENDDSDGSAEASG
jgi:hypothetical protein